MDFIVVKIGTGGLSKGEEKKLFKTVKKQFKVFPVTVVYVSNPLSHEFTVETHRVVV